MKEGLRSGRPLDETAQRRCQLSVKANQPHHQNTGWCTVSQSVSHFTLWFTWQYVRLGCLLSYQQLHLRQHRSVRYSKIHSDNVQYLYISGAYSVKCYLFYINYCSYNFRIHSYVTYSCVLTVNTTGNVRINVTTRRVRVTIVAVKKQ